jgi:hypothetical protein
LIEHDLFGKPPHTFPDHALVAILGRKLAIEFRRAYLIEIRELPFQASSLRSVMNWHRRFDDLPVHRWLRDTTMAAAAAV